MSSKMTVFGAGHKIALFTFPALALAFLLWWRYREFFAFVPLKAPVRLGVGIGLMAIGLVVNFVSAFTMMRAFKQQRLLTTGTYALSRNPMYASFIFITIPGLSLALNSWVLLLVSPVLYLTTSIFVSDEERWLAKHFGDQWEQYSQKVGRIFPKAW